MRKKKKKNSSQKLRKRQKEKELADVINSISDGAKEQKEALNEFVGGPASPKPQPVEIVAPVPSEEKDRVVASGIVPEQYPI